MSARRTALHSTCRTGKRCNAADVYFGRNPDLAQHLKRIFNIDIETCREWGGVKMIACIEDQAVMPKALATLAMQALKKISITVEKIVLACPVHIARRRAGAVMTSLKGNLYSIKQAGWL